MIPRKVELRQRALQLSLSFLRTSDATVISSSSSLALQIMRVMRLPWLCLSLLTAASAQSLGFDTREATIDSVHDSLFSGQASCRGIVSAFLQRIETHNSRINAILSLNPTVLAAADSLDHALSLGNATGSLFCVPILLKDNFDAVDMSTTGGSLALEHSRPDKDAPSVAALKRAGALVLGKVNLHELALEGLSVSSLGGQTVNPYDATRTPGGSSGGTGAAIAASFAVFGTGTGESGSRALVSFLFFFFKCF